MFRWLSQSSLLPGEAPPSGSLCELLEGVRANSHQYGRPASHPCSRDFRWWQRRCNRHRPPWGGSRGVRPRLCGTVRLSGTGREGPRFHSAEPCSFLSRKRPPRRHQVQVLGRHFHPVADVLVLKEVAHLKMLRQVSSEQQPGSWGFTTPQGRGSPSVSAQRRQRGRECFIRNSVPTLCAARETLGS